MLLELRIQNYAIIDDLSFRPHKGLNILTGETGAGKSILVGALGLLLGERAKADQERKCVIEGYFDVSGYDLADFFVEKDLDYEARTIMRREISAQGRSRAFINDTPVSLQDLKELGERLVDVHSQHQTLLIGNRGFQHKLIDVVSESWDLFLNYRNAYSNWQKSKARLNELRFRQATMERDLDFKKFQLDELIQANLTEGEQEALEEESALLENAGEILLQTGRGEALIDGGEASVTELLATYLAEIRQLNGGAKFETIRERILSALTELRDIASELSGFGSKIALDPERLQEVNDRLNLLGKLQQKHRVNSVEPLIAIREQLDHELMEAGDLTYEVGLEEKRCKQLKDEMQLLADELHVLRSEGIKGVEKRLNRDLELLGMPNARFRLGISKLEEPGTYGQDLLQIDFTANKGAAFQPVDKVASGGELSRIMLIIKSYLAEKTTLPTLIFDEIDTGVSGEIARKVADMMKALSGRHQLITITHLPQIAARGDAHYYVYKQDSGSRTITDIRNLTGPERVEEIARMLSGDNPTEGAMINARELME